jgi:hypothetical protein
LALSFIKNFKKYEKETPESVIKNGGPNMNKF